MKIKMLLCSLVFALVSMNVYAAKITGNELAELHNDTTFFGKHFKRGDEATYFSPDGTVLNKNGETIRKGTWKINKKNNICVAFDDVGKTFCHRVIKNKKDKYKRKRKDKTLVHIREIKKGNHIQQ